MVSFAVLIPVLAAFGALATAALGYRSIRPPRGSADEDLPALTAAARRQRGRFLAVSLPLYALVLGAGIVVVLGFSGARDARIESLALGMARSLAFELEECGHYRIPPQAGFEDAVYTRLYRKLATWLALNPAAVSAYTMRPTDEGAVFVLDSAVDYDRDGRIDGPLEAASVPGTPYRERLPELDAAFSGTAAFERRPSRDAWGLSRAAFAPIRAPDGRVEAVVGIDFDAAALSSDEATYNLAVSALCLLLYGAIASLLAARGRAGVETLRGELERERVARLATRDRLTGVANRYAFESVFDSIAALARRNGLPLALILFDVDFFKEVNDRFGHAVGDRVLRAVAEIAQSEIRASDSLARWGGDEFVVLCPGTSLSGARHLAERLLARTRAADLGLDAPLGLSIGVAAFAGDEDLESLLKRADAALYRAKAMGRARVAE